MPRSQNRKTPDEVTLIRDFPGLVTNADPNDLAEGSARIQVNATASLIGQLSPRGGCRPVKFED